METRLRTRIPEFSLIVCLAISSTSIKKTIWCFCRLFATLTRDTIYRFCRRSSEKALFSSIFPFACKLVLDLKGVQNVDFDIAHGLSELRRASSIVLIYAHPRKYRSQEICRSPASCFTIFCYFSQDDQLAFLSKCIQGY